MTETRMSSVDGVMGHDPNCGAWIGGYREPAPESGRRRARI